VKVREGRGGDTGFSLPSPLAGADHWFHLTREFS
jgi:hypothetical protein